VKNRQREFVKLDADESIFFARELESVKSKTYDRLYPEYKALSLIPVSEEVDPGAETIKYESYEEVGIAQLLASYSDDVPRADVKGTETRSPVKPLASSYAYNLQEIRAARMAGKPLAQKKANAAKRAIDYKQNLIAFFGDTATGLLGLLNHPNIQEYTVPADGSGSSKLWSTKTADQMLRDMNGVVNQVFTVTNGVHQADTLLLPLAAYTLAATTRIGVDSNMTVLKFFMESNPFIKEVTWLNELKNAGAASVGRMVAYMKSPDVLTLEIPQPFEQLPVQEEGFEFITYCHQRTGGVIVYYPMAICFGDGITPA
jgi:hypothetical protein